jgi:phosphoribosylaminoimidazole-succinocarboxamide synthase
MLAADRFVRSGKVRDLYTLDAERLLSSPPDRLSAFDVVPADSHPGQGPVLTALSRFWFAETAAIIPNHLLGTDPGDACAIGRQTRFAGGRWCAGGRTSCRSKPWFVATWRVRLEGIPRDGSVCGVALPTGLRESDRLPEPIFTPATKEEGGAHDVNISFDDMVDHLAAVAWLPAAAAGPWPRRSATRPAAVPLRFGVAAACRILLADTKFEFGFVPDDAGDGSRRHVLTLVDEALTPDSSRFWDARTYEPGRAQASYDKQFVRDWLDAQAWDKRPPGPSFPTTSSRERAHATSRRTSGSPARASRATSRRTSSPDEQPPLRRQRHPEARHPRPAGPGRRGQPGSPRHRGRVRRPGGTPRRIDRRSRRRSRGTGVVERLASELLSNPPDRGVCPSRSSRALAYERSHRRRSSSGLELRSRTPFAA